MIITINNVHYYYMTCRVAQIDWTVPRPSTPTCVWPTVGNGGGGLALLPVVLVWNIDRRSKSRAARRPPRPTDRTTDINIILCINNNM